MKKKQVPLTPAELAAEKAAWREQELKVDHADRIIKMTPQQYAEVAAQILKDRAGKLGDYQELYENLAARLNLSFKKLNQVKDFMQVMQ